MAKFHRVDKTRLDKTCRVVKPIVFRCEMVKNRSCSLS